MSKIKFIFIALFGLTLLLEGVQVYLSNRIAGTSAEVAKLRRQIQTMDEKNTSLRAELLAYSSFERISSRAAELGFVENSNNAIMLKAPREVAISR